VGVVLTEAHCSYEVHVHVIQEFLSCTIVAQWLDFHARGFILCIPDDLHFSPSMNYQLKLSSLAETR
jgi:hypothetical protein